MVVLQPVNPAGVIQLLMRLMLLLVVQCGLQLLVPDSTRDGDGGAASVKESNNEN